MQCLTYNFLMIHVCLWLLQSFGNPMQAQHVAYIFQHLDREDGLASNMVLSILQDKQGFIWFGTNNGLQRYDGRKYTHFRYQLNNPNSLASDMVESLLEDRKGNIWIAAPGAVTVFSPQQGRFSRIGIKGEKESAASFKRRVLTECNSQIFLSSYLHNERYVYDSLENTFIPYIPLDHTGNGYLPCKKEADVSLPATEPYLYLQDRRGRTWAAGEKLQVKQKGSATFEEVHSTTHIRYGIDFNLIFSIIEDREGTIWLGTDRGVYYFNPDKQQFFSVSFPAIEETEPASTVVTGFLETDDKQIWVSSLNKGIAIFDHHLLPVKRVSATKEINSLLKSIWCLVQEPGGNIWAASQGGKFVRISPDTETIQYFHPAEFKGQTAVKATIDKDGSIWWGTEQGLLVRHNPETQQFHTLPIQDTLIRWGKIKRILTGNEPYLWIATANGGVLKLDKITGQIYNKFNTATKPNSLLSDETGDMIWYATDVLAVSTSLGIHFINTQNSTIQTYTTENGLPANAILDIVPTNAQSLFLTTQTSLSMWNRANRRVTTYGVKDGIIHESFAFNTGYQLKDRRILLGTLQDFFYFHPDSLLHQFTPPKVLVTGFKVFDRYMPIKTDSLGNGDLHLSYKQNFFNIEFASLSYYDASKVNYYYKLEGVDKDWIKAGQVRFASYTDISGGNYEFKVKAESDDGTSSPYITTLNITIAHPFWKTPWFILAIIILIGAFIFLLYKIRLNRLMAMQQVRSRIAQDLHDDMGSTLSTIHILSELARQQAGIDTNKTKEHLGKINRYTHQMLEAIDDIVWSINPFNDSIQNLTTRMREFATELLEANDILFSLVVDTQVNALHIPMEARYDYFMIFKEAIHNAAKYAQCTRVEATIEVTNQELVLIIQDNGKGFDLSNASGGNGLLNMQNRAKAIKGDLEIYAQEGKGTRITLKAPISKGWTYFKKNDKNHVV